MTALSMWRDGAPGPQTDGPAPPDTVDVAVVGAGLTGLTTAVLLARAGVSVAVLEGRTVSAGTTGASTAKISLLQGTRLSTIGQRQPLEAVRRYVDANRDAQAWLVELCESRGVPLQRVPALTFAVGASGESTAREELEAARAAGLPVRWEPDVGLPFPTRGGVRLDDQVQTDPVALTTALTDEARAQGATVHEGVRVLGASGSGPVRLRTDAGEVTAGTVVLATGMPILDRGGFFTRMEPRRSYLVSFRGVLPPDGMFLSADQPSRSLRAAERDGEPLLLVGGEGHVTGRGAAESTHLDRLRDWTARHWPGALETHAWSAQDHGTAHELPFAGPLLPGAEHLLVAGGYSKWGFTNGVAAAMALAGRLTGRQPGWADLLEPWQGRELAGAGEALRLNATVGVHLVGGWLRPLLGGPDAGAEPRHDVSRVCTHLGGAVRWNDAERSWDCPLHGSRFAEDGSVLDAPATCGLRRV